MCLFGSSSVSVSLFPLSNVAYSQALDEDGIAAPGQIIRNHDVYVNKQSPKIVDRRGAGALLKDTGALACIVFSLLFCSIFASSILYL